MAIHVSGIELHEVVTQIQRVADRAADREGNARFWSGLKLGAAITVTLASLIIAALLLGMPRTRPAPGDPRDPVTGPIGSAADNTSAGSSHKIQNGPAPIIRPAPPSIPPVNP
jgi:hypothetical protein